ncbi:MAG TPA: DUF1043 family protein [Psychromonas sp.]
MAEMSGVLIFIIGGIVGGILGFVITRITLGRKQKAAQQEALDNTKAELDHYKSQVSNHFSDSAKLMGQVASSYQALYTHMAGQSEALLDATETEVPFPKLKTPPVKEQQDPLTDEEFAQETAEELLAAREAEQKTTDEPLAAKEAEQKTTDEPPAAKEAEQETTEEPLKAKEAEQEITQSEDAEEIREKKEKDSSGKSE